MADPLTILGGLAAGVQLVSIAAEALLATVKLLRDLKEIPRRLTVLLSEVEDSISRLCQSCNAGSKLFRNLDLPQINRLSGSANALYSALQEIHNVLMPLMADSKEKRSSARGLWRSIVSLKVERELAEKLTRLNRLNIEMVREIGILGLEVQVTTKGLVVASTEASSEAFSNIETKIDSLRNDFQDFTVSIHQAHAITLEKPNHPSLASDEWSLSPKPKLIKYSPCSSTSDNDSAICIQEPAEKEPLSQERAEQMRRYLAGRPATGTTSPHTMLSTNQLPNANLEFVLFSIRTFYTPGNFDAPSIIKKTEFWKDTDVAIYLMKVSTGATRGSTRSQTRGLRLLKNLTADDASHAWDQCTPTILIELLSTLSPVNTSTCSYVRDGLLRHLSQLAHQQLPRDHPIALVINILKNDKGDKNITLRALMFIVERLRATLSPVHALTQLATKRLCALLRRSGEYPEALQVARTGVQAIRAAMGPGSLQERTLLRAVAHVYIDQQNYPAALSVCFDIVGQRALDSPNPDPAYHDECAVYTMEDIAKTCECAGNLEQAVAWLKQARISAGMVWGRTAAIEHIQDKLCELLREMGREDELEIWSKTLYAEDLCEEAVENIESGLLSSLETPRQEVSPEV